jgi:hypothetical protein
MTTALNNHPSKHTGRHTASHSLGHSVLAPHIASLRTRLADRKALRSFRRELDTYATPAQINELLALIAEHDDAESQVMRGVLVSNLNHRS